MSVIALLLSLLGFFVLTFVFIPIAFKWSARLLGYRLRRESQGVREALFVKTRDERAQCDKGDSKGGRRKSDGDDWEEIESPLVGTADNGGRAVPDWQGVVGFFHPFCNAGGGGERVLWEAIRATQQRWPEAICVVYTGDHDVDKPQILKYVDDRFHIRLHSPNIHFLYLNKRDYVLASTWPHFTLAGQSLGSIILAFEAFQLLVPDIFIDTMGYAFALSLSSWLFPYVPTGAYVHYPTISSDMLDSLSTGGQGINAGTGVGLRGALKRLYWNLFAFAYSKVGSSIDVVMTNSSWTQSHIKQLWGPYRSKASADIDVVFPPVAVSEFERAISINEETERTQRKPHIIYIAQFRAEKNHELVLSAFANFIHSKPRLPAWPDEPPKLILIGNVREEDEKRIYRLRILARELNISDSVEFVCDAKFSSMLDFMAHASVGVNAMWSEHFGIGVVEYQAAGLISVVNDSGGPKLDIVVDVDGRPTGFHASTEQQYADAFLKALSLPRNDALAMRHRARKSARRFTDRAFAEKWIANMDRLVLLQVERTRR